VGATLTCRALGVSRASFYRHKAGGQAGLDRLASAPPSRRKSARALSEAEEQKVLSLLNSPRFEDKAPAEVFATLLDEGAYVCSVSSMYRLLKKHAQVGERRRVLRHPHYQKPELLATGPNQVWTWDITRLKGVGKWTYYCLYVILDLYSRYVVGWCVAYRESAPLAEQLILDACLRQGIAPGQLTIHADRGSAMTSKAVAQLLADLGVEKTHARPHVSNDNPYSEAQFKTMKYRPDFPERFGSREDAQNFCYEFFAWYNTEHRHSGIALLTPQTVHDGQAGHVLQKRASVLKRAYAAHPERFVRQVPRPAPLPEAAWINPPETVRADAATGAALLQ
jgi:putative transposase